MTLIRKIRDLFSLPKLHERIEALELELKYERGHSGPSFVEVSKDLDVSAVSNQITERIIDDFSPFLERHAIGCLKQAFRDERTGKLPRITAAAAYDVNSRYIHIRAHMDSIETSFNVAL